MAGGFDGTSNVLAGKLTGIMVSGTHAHAFVQSYTGFHMIQDPMLNGVDLLAQVQELRTTKPMCVYLKNKLNKFKKLKIISSYDIDGEFYRMTP